MEDILVSIHCTTYNHEKYIEDAIESFLMQKTDFKFEVLIHDDASTDRTAEIIREYEKQHPNLIKPIYQTVNQKSKGQSIGELNLKRAKGKYIAICEGDDYWTDPYKLQKQVDYMEKNPECSLIVHGGYVVNASDKHVISKNRPYKGNKIFHTEEIIEGDGGLFLTNSMLYPRKYINNRPDFYNKAPVGDYPLAIYLSLLGTVNYIDEFMSAYRTGVSNSWTERNTSTINKRIEHYKRIAVMLDEINQYTNGKYENAINRTKNKNQFNLLINQRKFKEAKSGKTKEHFLELGFREKFIVFIKQYFYFFVNIGRYVRSKWGRWAIR